MDMTKDESKSGNNHSFSMLEDDLRRTEEHVHRLCDKLQSQLYRLGCDIPKPDPDLFDEAELKDQADCRTLRDLVDLRRSIGIKLHQIDSLLGHLENII